VNPRVPVAKLLTSTVLVALFVVILVALVGDVFGVSEAEITPISSLWTVWGRTPEYEVRRLGDKLRALKTENERKIARAKNEAAREGGVLQEKIRKIESASADKVGALRSALARDVKTVQAKLTDATARAESATRRAAEASAGAVRGKAGEAHRLADRAANAVTGTADKAVKAVRS